jgi:DNA-binding protein H-NS
LEISLDIIRAVFMSKNIQLEALSLDNLWSLYEKVSAILSARIKSEKHELERRLAFLNRRVDGGGQVIYPNLSDGKPRRKYPRVLPKYRNPRTSETWSGRGKHPLWLVDAIKSGHKIEDYRIAG